MKGKQIVCTTDGCDSDQFVFGTPIWRDYDCTDVVVQTVCEECGSTFQVFGYVTATGVN